LLFIPAAPYPINDHAHWIAPSLLKRVHCIKVYVNRQSMTDWKGASLGTLNRCCQTDDEKLPGIFFVVDGALVYLDEPVNGTLAAFEKGFSASGAES
jgi:hypothetical protein